MADQTLRPLVNGTTLQWTPSSGTDHAALIRDDPDAPNQANYITESTVGQVDQIELDPLAIYTDQITLKCDLTGGGPSTPQVVARVSVNNKATWSAWSAQMAVGGMRTVVLVPPAIGSPGGRPFVEFRYEAGTGSANVTATEAIARETAPPTRPFFFQRTILGH